MKALRGFASAAVMCMLSFCMLICGAQPAAAYETVSAEISVACLAVDRTDGHVYHISIEADNAQSPAPLSDELEIMENGSGRFQLNLTEPGTFVYRVYEPTGDDPAISYDDNVYLVTVFVENAAEDTLVYAVSARRAGSDSKTEKIEFQNLVLADRDSDSTTTATTTTTAVTTETTAVSSVSDSDTETTLTSGTSATTSTTVTTAASADSHDIHSMIDDVLTGDSFPAHAVRIIMLIAALTAVGAFLFKRERGEEADEDA